VQATQLLRPVDGFQNPTEHERQPPVPFSFWYFPAGQNLQEDFPDSSWKVPAGHVYWHTHLRVDEQAAVEEGFGFNVRW
jgi:hypothetical protein